MDDLSPALIATIVISLLGALLLYATWTDVRSRRIPNRLVFVGAGVGLLLNSVLPEGFGFVSGMIGALGFWKALAGMGLGLGLMLPLYMVRGVGAGDVKLIAMIGAFLGPNATLGTVLLTFIVGGVMALLLAARNGTMGQLYDNLRMMLLNSFFKLALREMPTLDAAPVSAGKLPYGVAIAAGTFAYIVLERSGRMNFLKLF
jgi:prepilin peptidase CpaA